MPPSLPALPCGNDHLPNPRQDPVTPEDVLNEINLVLMPMIASLQRLEKTMAKVCALVLLSLHGQLTLW